MNDSALGQFFYNSIQVSEVVSTLLLLKCGSQTEHNSKSSRIAKR